MKDWTTRVKELGGIVTHGFSSALCGIVADTECGLSPLSCRCMRARRLADEAESCLASERRR